MRALARLIVPALALALSAPLGACAALDITTGDGAGRAATPGPFSCREGATLMARVELIFATSPRGTPFAEPPLARLQRFLEEEVTPRFPDGFTLYTAYGQWRAPEGDIRRLDSRVLQIWYAPTPENDAKIEAIRDAYKRIWNHVSVMRIDGTDCVAF